MKLKLSILIYGVLSAALFSQAGFASISNKKGTSRSQFSAVEILELPEPLRMVQVQGRENDLYPKVIEIAFSSKRTVELRWKALTMAAHLKKEKSIVDLKKALKSPDWFMRNAALLSLQSVSEREGRLAALDLVTDKALVVRSAAVEVLGSSMDPETRDLFWREMDASYNFRKNQSLWIREQLLGFLARKPELSEKNLFQTLTESSPPAMKALAKNALAQLNN